MNVKAGEIMKETHVSLEESGLMNKHFRIDVEKINDVTDEFEVRSIQVTKVPYFAEAEVYHKKCCHSSYVPLHINAEFECECFNHKRYRIAKILPLKIVEVVE